MPDYNVQICKKLEQNFHDADLLRPIRSGRYDAGDVIDYEIKYVISGELAKVKLKIVKFVGGGFAGQVYQIRILDIYNKNQFDHELVENNIYAMKILIPPSGFSNFFRNAVYWIGFQGPFQLQVNPVASLAGAIWQKFIRRAARIKFGDENSVVDIYATLVDEKLGSCGEISEWIEGRTWQLEVDEKMDHLKGWRRGKTVPEGDLGSPEYRAKKIFMKEFVKLLHELGGYEFARQYEWSTCKSQPNCLKRDDSESDPEAGLTAVDFRAGLALLPFLPMSPGDIKLIFKGWARGSIVQFDRGNISKLEKYVNAHQQEFSDLKHLLKDLKICEDIYRNSLPDITHNHFKLFYSKKLWQTIFKFSIKGWRIQNQIDDKTERKLSNNKFLTFLFYLLSLIPIFGKKLIKFFGCADIRKHYFSVFTKWNYFRRTLKGTIAEKLIFWYRGGRIEEKTVERISKNGFLFFIHLPFSILPAGLHKFLTNWGYFVERLHFIIVRPVKLYFDSDLREEWLRDMVTEGRKKHMLSNDDVKVIESQIEEPYIQKYLKSLAVHVCTLPITQVVSVLIAIIYVLTHPEMPRAQAWGIGVGIIALFQVIPISPGSLVRGLYVVYLVIREKDFKNYNIAVFLAFFKYIGYLAFPIQMTYRYPALARFMAGHWATEAVHIVPVFGERGALLEHWVYGLFYNWPLTIRRRMNARAEFRSKLKPRYWHIGLYSIIFALILGSTDWFYITNNGILPQMKSIWWAILGISVLNGILITSGSGGTALGKRIISVATGGILLGMFYTIVSLILSIKFDFRMENILAEGIWRIFIFAVFSTISSIITELSLPEPK